MAVHAFYIRATPFNDEGNHRVGAIAYKIRKDGKILVAGSLIHPGDRITGQTIKRDKKGRKVTSKDVTLFKPKSCLKRAKDRLKQSSKSKIIDLSGMTCITELFEALSLPVDKHYRLYGDKFVDKLDEIRDKVLEKWEREAASKQLRSPVKSALKVTSKPIKPSKPTIKSKAK